MHLALTMIKNTIPALHRQPQARHLRYVPGLDEQQYNNMHIRNVLILCAVRHILGSHAGGYNGVALTASFFAEKWARGEVNAG